jgi:hypothetical protein
VELGGFRIRRADNIAQPDQMRHGNNTPRPIYFRG